jgi:hypothetical protein
VLINGEKIHSGKVVTVVLVLRTSRRARFYMLLFHRLRFNLRLGAISQNSASVISPIQPVMSLISFECPPYDF